METVMTTLASESYEFPNFILQASERDVFRLLNIYSERVAFLLERAREAEIDMLKRLKILAPHLDLENRVYKFVKVGARLVAEDMGPRISPVSLPVQNVEGP